MIDGLALGWTEPFPGIVQSMKPGVMVARRVDALPATPLFGVTGVLF